MNDPNALARSVGKIISRVIKDGDRALSAYSLRFDGVKVRPSDFFAGRARMAEGLRRCPKDVLWALKAAKARIERFHREEAKRLIKSWSVSIDGIRAGQTARPVSRAAVYAPGGRTCYPSSVLMTAIPAKIAGVDEIILATPMKNLKDEVLAAAYLAGVDRILCLGGPWAIAALAYGTQTVPKVDKIAGPGNEYVTEAKRQVYGQVGIDGLAGPSEIAVWADARTDPEMAAMNLAAQAEHDPGSKGYLLTSDRRSAEEIRRRIPSKFLKQMEIRVLGTDASIAKRINEIAPEHLYLALSKPARVLKLIRNAGAIFLGETTSVPLGDYTAGPSHVLPTGTSARFGSGLSVKDFMKWNSVIERTRGKGKDAVRSAKIIAGTENLRYHIRALEACG
ncbi:MAG: histidinol dehydrogenase [Elusimicrobia bacterium RIFCSPLOWO2_01_FULL_60_11]|nr:MAG: histidinol dehydrogenase [Elusimicrobia bacterium RIFCSPLOWO2_01_FULL_60_11]